MLRLKKSQTPMLVAILAAYIMLVFATGYLAFFQERYNPAADLGEKNIKLLQDPTVANHILDAIRVESSAFKARKELAAQSFNVVLGALLGFLSATAVATSQKNAEGTGP
ncbi:hypothetical protein [Cerasicoccus frondis]|uniref:hypothetical protein n=1 Tax=Cerasicoccus frondis TaxID=490090 RepID=UPI0028529270|nr:hypothetical protein [Cerasicoccus frondis]